MLKQDSNYLTNIKSGEQIYLSIPVGNDTFSIYGKAHFNNQGDVVIEANPFGNSNFYLTDGTVTIKRKNGTFDAKDLDISISGVGKSQAGDEDVKDFNINISDDKVTLINAPTGLESGTYAIANDMSFQIVDSNGNAIALADNYTVAASGIESTGANTSVIRNNTSGGGGGGGITTTKNNNYANNNLADLSGAKDPTAFTPTNHNEYWNKDFQSIIDNTSNVNYDTLAQQLKSDVEFLSSNFSKVKSQITQWSGSASDSAKGVFDAVISKFDCTMSNINDSIGPACTKIEDFKEKLEKLKKGKEELTGADGNGGLDKELDDLNKDYEEKKKAYETLKNNEPPKTKTITGDDGKTTTTNNPEHDTWASNLSSAETAMNEANNKVVEKQNEIKAKEAELDLLLEDVKETYSMIQTLCGQINTFKDYLGSGSKASIFSSADSLLKNYEKISNDFGSFDIALNTEPGKKSKAVLADAKFFEKACKEHASEGWSINNGVVTMNIDGKKCTYDINKHKFSDGTKTQLEAYFYLPSHIANSNDYSQLSNLNTYTFFSSSQKMYANQIQNKEINTVTMMVVKQDPLNDKYGAVTSLTKMANKAANTNLTKCQNIIGGDSVYGAHSLKIAASNGDLYKTVYCVDNAAIVTGVNGKAGTKEQFSSLDQLKGLDGKNVYFISTSGDDNYAMGADMSVQRGRAYVNVGTRGNITTEQVKNSFTYTGIELVAKTCPNAKVHIVYQDQDTAKNYQKTNFPKALDELASKYSNVTNNSKDWDKYASKKYKTHSEGNYIPHDLASAFTTTNTAA